MTKHERVQIAADALVELKKEATTGYPKPMLAEAIVRQIQIAMAEAQLLAEIGHSGWWSNRRQAILRGYNYKVSETKTKRKRKRKRKKIDSDDDPRFYERNFNRNSRW